MIDRQPELFWSLIASMWVGNLMLLVINLPLVGGWIRLIGMPYRYLFPAIVVFCAIGAYSVQNSEFDVFLMALFGAVGYALLRLRFEPAPLLLGFVLAPLLEENFRRAMVLSQGDANVFVTRPISACLLAFGLALLAILAMQSFRRRREEIFVE